MGSSSHLNLCGTIQAKSKFDGMKLLHSEKTAVAGRSRERWEAARVGDAGLNGHRTSSHFLVESLVEGAGNYKGPWGLQFDGGSGNDDYEVQWA
eukprot:scaffold8733_cov191-Skeletonema_dohrnii-CCMP3373.AAC.9